MMVLHFGAPVHLAHDEKCASTSIMQESGVVVDEVHPM